MVFDGVVSSSFELPGKVSPLVAHIFVKEEEGPFLVEAPLFLIDVRVEVVVPSFPALFSYPSWVKKELPGMF